MKRSRSFDAVTVTLNPAIDRTLTISNFEAGKVNRVESSHDIAGGKGVNVAAALADFGLHVAVTGFLGADNTEAFTSLFKQKKITDYFIRIAGQTRVGIKITDPIRQRTTDINFPGLSPEKSEIKALLRSLDDIGAAKPTWFVLAGSLPPKVDKKIYRELITRLKKRGHKILLDTSGDALRHGVTAAPNIIKPNIHELEELTGKRLKTDRAVIQAARELNTSGIELVVVSLGERGACFVNAKETVIARPPRVEVKSTVGAGDALVAGLIAAIVRKDPLPNCARLAIAFSLETLTRTDRSLRSPTAARRWMSQVRLDA